MPSTLRHTLRYTLRTPKELGIYGIEMIQCIMGAFNLSNLAHMRRELSEQDIDGLDARTRPKSAKLPGRLTRD